MAVQGGGLIGVGRSAAPCEWRKSLFDLLPTLVPQRAKTCHFTQRGKNPRVSTTESKSCLANCDFSHARGALKMRGVGEDT
jgi:hypothetical protein